MKKHIANLITCLRILGSVLLLLFPVFSVEFYIIYIICGFSDMIDGTIARKTNSTSNFGSILDSIADFVFVIISIIKILPKVIIVKWVWIWIIVIGVIKIIYIIGIYVSKNNYVSMHTIMNKITGLSLFLLPLTFSFIEIKYSIIVVCIIATLSVIQEMIYIMKSYKFK